MRGSSTSGAMIPTVANARRGVSAAMNIPIAARKAEMSAPPATIGPIAFHSSRKYPPKLSPTSAWPRNMMACGRRVSASSAVAIAPYRAMAYSWRLSPREK